MRVADLGWIPVFARDLFSRQVIPVTEKVVLRWLPCQEPGFPESAPGLAGQVSVYCDWVRQKAYLQFLSQCVSTCHCLTRFNPEIHLHVAGTFSTQQTTVTASAIPQLHLQMLGSNFWLSSTKRQMNIHINLQDCLMCLSLALRTRSFCNSFIT